MPSDPPSHRLPAAPTLAGASATGTRSGGLVLGRGLSLRWPRLALAEHPLAGRLGLGALVAFTFLVVAFACASQGVLAPRSYLAFPLWLSGPLHLLFRWMRLKQAVLNWGFSGLVIAMLFAYGFVLSALRTLSLRTIVAAILALHVLVVFSPPLQLTDVFNYLGYARLGGLHHLSPYTHVIRDELHDPIFRLSSWHSLSSPYGPLFTLISYPLAWLPIPVAYWIIKILTMLASLGFIALVARCARQLGRDPRYALAFVALNPIYVIYAMGGFHNDFFMLIPMLAAVSFVLDGRDRRAGAVLMLAVAVKFSAVLLLPFLIMGVRQARRRRQLVLGSVLGAVPLAALSLAMFGPHLPNLRDQSTLLTTFSIPNLVGLLVGADGGSPAVLKVANVLLVVAVALLLRRRGNWLTAAGWATVVLLASLAWLMPWYVIWVLPLAALATSIPLRRVALAFTVFLVLTFVPASGIVLFSHGLNPMNTRVGHASSALQKRLAH